MKYALITFTLSGALAACNRGAPAEPPAAVVQTPKPAEAPKPAETPEPAAKTWAPEAPDGWETARVEGQGWSLVAAVAGEPAAGAEVPVGRVTLKRGDAIVAQRPLGALVTVPEGESWGVLAIRQPAGGPHFVTIYAVGTTGADYLEHKKGLAVLPDDPKTLDPLWAGDGGFEQSMMGACETGILPVFAVEDGALNIAWTTRGQWVAEPPKEDWEKEIFAQCAPPEAPPKTRIPLK